VTRALHAEWTKLRTTSGPAWLVLGATACTVAVSLIATGATRYQAQQERDVIKLAFTGVYLGQAVVAAFAVVVIGGEYDDGMIRTTLTAIPSRLTVLTTKAIVVTGLVLASSIAAVVVSALVGRVLLTGNGFTAAHGYRPLSLIEASSLRVAGGTVLYLALVGLLSLGIATVVRDSATAIGAVLGLVYVFPILASVVTDASWHRHLEQIGPMTAGLAIQTTVNLRDLPISPWAGLGVLAAWAAAALLGGAILLHLRDA
jgi:ABC-2 type transport system permease protein